MPFIIDLKHYFTVFKKHCDNAFAAKTHTHTKADIGLEKVDNTSDIDKNVNSAIKDGEGNNIANTYAKKINEPLTWGKLNTNATWFKLKNNTLE